MFKGGDEMNSPISGANGHDSEDDIARLLAAEEAEIQDAGFSTRVRQEVGRTSHVRRLTLYCAGMLGFGVATGSVSGAVSNSPAFAQWVASFNSFLTPHLPAALEMDPLPLAVGLAAACVMAISVVYAAQGR